MRECTYACLCFPSAGCCGRASGRGVPHAARAPRESPPTPEEAGWGTQGAAIWRAKYAQGSTNSSPRMKADGYPSTPPRAPADPSRSQHAPAGRPEGRSAGFRGKMQIRLLGLFPGLMASTGYQTGPSTPRHVPARPGMSRQAPAGRCTPQQAPAGPSTPQQAPTGRPEGRSAGFRRKMQIGLWGLLSGLIESTGCPADPPGQLWAAPGVPWAASRRLLAASGGVWRPKRVFYAPRSARVAIGAGKHGTWTSEEGPKRVFSRLRREEWPTARVKTHKGAPVVTP